MARMIPLRRWSKPVALVLSTGLLCVAGCGPGGGSNPSNTAKFENSAPGNSTSPASPPSAEPTSFDETTARLDRGGAFYMYLSLAQWLDGLSGQLDKLRTSIPTDGMSASDRKQMDQMFNLGTTLIKNSGIEQITGVGASSLAVESGVYRNTFFVHHYKGKESGMLNTLFGTAPHALTALDLLPANTALASSGDYDLAGLIRALLQTIDQSGIPDLQKGKAEDIQKFQQATGMTLEEFLASLGQEINLVLTLDPSKQIEVPSGSGGTMKIPAPRLALLIEVKDDKYFNKIDELLGSLPPMISISKVDEPGLKMRTTSYPLGDFEVRPTVARWDKFLLIASDDHLIRDMIAVQKGGAGFKASPAFAKDSAGLPTQGNGFSLTTQALMQALRDYQKQTLASLKGTGTSPMQTEWLSKFLLSDTSGDSYGVSAHVENGWLAVGKGPTGVGKVLGPLVAMPAALAVGAALPAVGSVSEKGKATKSLAQAKQIGLACKLYASDNDGKFPPTLDALVPMYLNDKKLFVSPFAPDEPEGYTYHAGLLDSAPAGTVLLEDQFAPGVAGQKVIVHVDDSGEVTKATEE